MFLVEDVELVEFLDLCMFREMVSEHAQYLAKLNTDFRGELFEGSKRLLELADSVKELKSICKCGRKALFNRRLNDSKEQVVLGSEDMYITVCRKCFMEGK